MDTQTNITNNSGDRFPEQAPLDPGQVPGSPQNSSLKIKIIIILILLIAVVLTVYFYNRWQLNNSTQEIKQGQKQEQKKVVVTAGLPEGVSLIPLAPGKLPDGFPKDLIIYDKAQNIQSSENIIPNNEKHLVVQFTVASGTPEQVSKNYQTSLLVKQWKVGSSGNYDKDYYVTMASSTNNVTITITPQDAGSTVSLDYYQSK